MNSAFTSNSLPEPLPAIAANDLEQEHSRSPILTEAERRRILVEWNQTTRDYPHKCLHEVIEAQADSVPGHPAVVCRTQALSYREFNDRANQLAHYLRSRGVGPNERVGICLEPSTEFAIAVLAVLKSGAACVPLDPNYPADRRAYMLQDVQARLLISGEGMLPEAAASGCELLFLADHLEAISSQPRSNPDSGVKPDHIAYVIYTSGSTGKPRGVLLTHAGLVNYNANAARLYSITPNDRVLQFCSVSFDIALEEQFITWLSGATLVQRTDETPLAVPEFLEWIEQQRVTVLDLPTAYWHEWVHELPELTRLAPPELRLVIVGGEKPSSQAYAVWRKAVGPRIRWINTYGPTEASICATAFEPGCNPDTPVPDNIPIGRPLPNTRVYVLDRHLNPVPVGTSGELHIAGVGVARGYFNRPEMTAEKFIPDPFSSEPGARLYKTGDLARYLPSGDIEFLGRRDHQIKIRGFRVEPGEIETALSKHPTVREVAVIAREDVPGDKRLVAYLVPVQGTELSTAELRRYLQGQLPDHMVPSAFVILPAMPLTPNGKINRRGLPAPEFETVQDGFAIPTDALQAQLVPLWESVLGRKPIGVRDDFFEMGGHSLLAARLMHRIGGALGKTLPLAMLFEAPTIEQLAKVLSQDGWSRHWSSLVPIQPAGSELPFFCVHGIGGNVLGFRQLAGKMSPDYPFYGLQSHGLDGQHPCHTSIEAMASHYLGEIRTVQPQGPYFFGGFSFGGLVAYEMAQQLLARGEPVGLLVLFDTYPGNSTQTGTSLIRQLFQPSRQHWFHDLPKAVGKKIRRSVRSLRVPQLLKDVRDSNRSAAANYVLRPYRGKATLVRATEKVRGSVDPHAAWNGLVGKLEIVEIASDHYDILLEPQVSHLAERLKECMAKARAGYEDARISLQAS
ncbi:MAG: amino acid adenylation domain-containing protein [Terriglobales bacterium]